MPTVHRLRHTTSLVSHPGILSRHFHPKTFSVAVTCLGDSAISMECSKRRLKDLSVLECQRLQSCSGISALDESISQMWKRYLVNTRVSAYPGLALDPDKESVLRCEHVQKTCLKRVARLVPLERLTVQTWYE